MRNKKWYATGIATAIIMIGCGTTEPDQDDINRLNDIANGSAAPTTTAKLPAGMLDAGTWEVGAKDNIKAGIISPGTYVISVSDNGYNCYWARVKNFDNELTSIISNDNVSPGATVKVVVKKSDKGLDLKGDCFAVKQKR